MLEFNIALRLLLELCAIAAVSYWGFRATGGLASWALGIGAPLAVAVFWGVLVAPQSPVQAPDVVKTALALTVFALASIALARAGRPRWGVGLITVALLNAWGLYLTQA